MGVRDWDIITNYVDSVTTSLKTVTFPKVQESVKVKNQGNANLTYTIGTQSGALAPNQSVNVSESISSFTIQSVSGVQSFEVRAVEKGTEQTETETDVMSLLAEKASQSTVNLKADKIYVDTVTQSLATGSPKGTYATLSALQTAFPTGNTNIYLVTADGKWYYWSGSAWTAGGIYQSTGFANNSIVPSNLSNTFFNYNGYKSDLMGTTGKDYAYVSFVFDTNGLIATSGQKLTATASIYTQETGLSLALKMFQSDVLDAGSFTFTNVAENGLLNLNEYTDFNNAAISTSATPYRYIKLLFMVKSVGLINLRRLYFSNVTCTVGGIVLPLALVGMHQPNPLNTVTQTTTAPFLLPRKTEVPTSLSQLTDDIGASNSRWAGKKGGALGDSITAGQEWINNAWVTVSTTYHQHLKNKLGMTSMANYGIASTSISATSDYTDNTNAFVNRYSSMANDLDLILVFGGTNDFGHNTPLGTIADTTDVSFYGALNVLMSGLTAKYPGKRIVFMTPLHRNRNGTEGETNAIGITLKQYVQAIRDVAEKYAIPVVDTYSKSGLTPFVQTIYDTYMTDGLHPTTLGHELLANNIVGQFKAL